MESIFLDHCPVCDSHGIGSWREVAAGGIRYRLDRCRACGYCFVNPRPSSDFLRELYVRPNKADDLKDDCAPVSSESTCARHQEDLESTRDAERIVARIGALLPERNDLLDVGCGRGVFSRKAEDAGFVVSAIELSETDRAEAQKCGINLVGDMFESFRGADGTFSAILMSQVLEHALDVNLWIEKAGSLLRNDGILAVALPNFASLFRYTLQERDPYIIPPEHLNFFSARNLELLVTKHGFHVEHVEWTSPIPSSTVQRRLPRPLWPLTGLLHGCISPLRWTLDRVGLGIMINLYARRSG